ncbi:hypothetical protein [Tenacibaculum singaporense]|uniref:DUF2158 domain-containing protein n=1 Tax=Tenacibaculum singaporense TaxID=2358479 RepID=A0A3S8R9J6_9FLAO|nr:hypothetical protein [Tenacibaculum singaporense]AZJ36458.1 hypothetical protein D6T69_13375 [Tenacibaculum singaporense]
MSRKFKSGDWVKLKGSNKTTKMEVLKYILKKDVLLGINNKDTYLECVWYEDGERKSKIFHQNNLVKLPETGGLYKV